MAAPTLPPQALSDGTITLRPLDDSDWRIEQELSQDDAVVTWTTYPAHLDEVQALARVRRAAR